ncbi:MAG: histidine kinase [Candidatus Nanopelagicales bacterium]|nr:histidine kinase [Candidatus Nanopelagicales bacterium]
MPMNSKSKLHRFFSDAIRVAFGPWQIRPWVVGILLAILFNYSSVEIFKVERGTEVDGLQWLVQVPNALFVGMMYVLPALAWNFLATSVFKLRPNRWNYLGAVIGLALLGTAGRAYLMPWWDFNYLDSPSQIFAMAFRIAAGQLIVFALLGLNDRRLKQQIARTERALAEVRDQRTVMINNEENLRSSISAYLHDNVQASLVALAMQLNLVAKRADTQLSAEISSIVDGLEEVRSSEVRKASHRLSPDISFHGLPSAIRELAVTYEPWMLTTVNVTEEWAPGDAVPERRDIVVLGAYRMIEQALLNSAIHGRARRVEVSISMNSDELLVHVVDDGHGFVASSYQPGTGSKVIDAWVQSLDGTWSIESNSDFGVHVYACLPLSV